MKSKRFFLLIISCFLLSFLLSGCATVPSRESLPTYTINGTTYFPLLSLCDARDISWQYDAVTRSFALNKASHRINLTVGQSLVLVDGEPLHLNSPVDIYQGIVVVPYRFKEKILDVYFKPLHAAGKPVLASSKIKTITIDAGHGGNDPGAIARSGLREKDVNLDIAKRLAKLLKSYGFEVIMTRSTDRFIPLSRRSQIANDAHADIFLSVHSNANRVRSLSGFEVYYVAPSVSDSKRGYAAAQDAALNLAGAYFADRSLDVKAIVWDMIYTNSRAESIQLSRLICRSVSRNLDTRILGIKAARFEVLKGVRMPGVLVEIGFLSNFNEERRLRNSYYRQKIAESIAEAIENYARDFTLVKE
ncbi:MAG: N-acetylmuramoyl-L-alanine amidase [Candidatus Omnitrophica bacterium]|nr:N-acetylmuramoyl-L-alanine amidase [Candidatus Omnitrophota bacterium]